MNTNLQQFHSDVQKLYLNTWASFFFALLEYNGWTEDIIDTLGPNTHSIQNMDLLYDALTVFYINGTKPNLTLNFYINSDDLIMQDAIPTEDPNLYTSSEAFYYNPQAPEATELLDHIYTDPLTGIQFNCFID